MAWYKVITGRDFESGHILKSDEERAALELAEAEVHLANAMREEERFLDALETGEDLALQLRRVREIVKEIRHSISGTSPDVERLLLAWRRKVPYRITRKITETWTEPHVRHERLARYRKAAEVRRHKALQAWIEIFRRRMENSIQSQMHARVV